MANKRSKFYEQDVQSGASLIAVLVSLALIGLASVAALNALTGYYEGKKGIDAMGSAGEAQRMIIAEITETLRRYVLFQGCATAAPPGIATVNLLAFEKFIQTIPGNSAAAINSRLGRLCRMPSRCANVIFERDGRGAASTSYAAASAARADCPADVAGPSDRRLRNCFKFEASGSAGRSGQNAFLRPSNQIFVHVISEIINLRDFSTLTCSSVIRNTNNNFRNFSIAAAIAGPGGVLPFQTYSESRVLGSGLRHTYSLYWEMGGRGKKKYFRKSGVLYVPNSVTR